MSKISEDLIVWSCEGDQWRLAARCGDCGGLGRFAVSDEEYENCDACAGLGWFGIDPKQPVMAHAGSVAKVAMLAARYATGSPLWHAADGFDPDVMARKPADNGQTRRPLTTAETPRAASQSPRAASRANDKKNRRLARLAP